MTAAAAVAFVWLGMVLAISFVEAPLKFRAPGVTRQLGLGIGRLVFRALHTIECVLAAAVLVLVLLGGPETATAVALAVVLVVLAVQRRRPPLTRAPGLHRPGVREGGRPAGVRSPVPRLTCETGQHPLRVQPTRRAPIWSSARRPVPRAG